LHVALTAVAEHGVQERLFCRPSGCPYVLDCISWRSVVRR